MSEINFDDVYAGYVIRHTITGLFIGPSNDMMWVVDRKIANRFTKYKVLSFLNSMPDNSRYVIEDAV